MECSARESLWYNSVHCLQDQRGKNREIIQALQSCTTVLPDKKWRWHIATIDANLLLSVPNDLWSLHCCLRRCGHHSLGSGEWLWFSLFGCASTVGYNNSVMAHVTWWRSKCRRWGISGLHDWWPVYCCALFHFLSWHKHHNNAVMSGGFPGRQMVHPLYFPASLQSCHMEYSVRINFLSRWSYYFSYLFQSYWSFFFSLLFWHFLSLFVLP